jgi:hypothetical protein
MMLTKELALSMTMAGPDALVFQLGTLEDAALLPCTSLYDFIQDLNLQGALAGMFFLEEVGCEFCACEMAIHQS